MKENRLVLFFLVLFLFMTINTNQGLEFQKNKIGKIDSKKASSVDTPTQSVTISSVGSTASISTGGY